MVALRFVLIRSRAGRVGFRGRRVFGISFVYWLRSVWAGFVRFGPRGSPGFMIGNPKGPTEGPDAVAVARLPLRSPDIGIPTLGVPAY